MQGRVHQTASGRLGLMVSRGGLGGVERSGWRSEKITVQEIYTVNVIFFKARSVCPRLPSSALVRTASSISTHAWGRPKQPRSSGFNCGCSQASRKSILADSLGIETKRRGCSRADRSNRKAQQVPCSPELPAGTRHTSGRAHTAQYGLAALLRHTWKASTESAA